MRKTKLLLLTILLCVVGVVKAVETTDKMVIGELTVVPGGSGDAVFTVSLEGSLKYTAYQVSLVLPEGLEVCYLDGYYDVYMLGSSGFYPRRGNSHSLGANVVDGVLNVTCFSSTNAEFSATSGELFEVYVKASPYLKPGDVHIGVENVKLVTVDEVKYEPADYVSTSIKAAATSTVTLKVSAENQFGTCILPFDYTLPADGKLEAYTCNRFNGEVLLLDKATTMQAYIPYILYTTTGFTSTISGTVDASKYPSDGIVKEGYLVGTVVAKKLTEGSYVMQNQGEGIMFYRVGTTPFALSAGKCYVELPAGTASPSFRIGGTTGIDNTECTIENSQFYNVLGQPVDRMIPGHIYIVDGHKVIAK